MAGFTSRTQYGGGGSQLLGTAGFQADALEGLGGGGRSGTADLRELLSVIDARRARQARAERNPPLGGGYLPDQQLKASQAAAAIAEARARAAKARALTQRAPQRFISGPGIIPGYVTDPSKMSGAARQVFLPGENVFVNRE